MRGEISVQWDEFFSTGLKVVATLGGIGIVAGGVAAWISQHLSASWLQAHKGELDRQLESHKAELAKATETHKLTLRRQELLFQREIEAADAFMIMRSSIWPQYEHADMDWHDACIRVAEKLADVERALDEFLARHTAVIGKPVRDKVEHARTVAAHEKFFVTDHPQPPDSAIKAAESVLGAIQEAEEQIYADLRR